MVTTTGTTPETAPGARAGTTDHLRAHPGARLVLHSCTTGTPARDGEILEVRGPHGGPPYLVRWASDGHVSLVFPGPGATIG